jgi:hypothetical protein
MRRPEFGFNGSLARGYRRTSEKARRAPGTARSTLECSGANNGGPSYGGDGVGGGELAVAGKDS